MAPFSKPETVLKQAEGLVSVGQTHAALQSLSEMFSSKRFRSTPLASLEPIMLRFMELCVELRKGRAAKEGLMQYKNIAQNTSVGSIEVVVSRFIEMAETKVREAQDKAKGSSSTGVADVDDLEASETPESILLGAVSVDQSQDRTDRALVTPWLKFLWEAYRTSLETLKNNSRLETIYQTTAQGAFRFCLAHSRKVEFRRLCDTLRLHLANVGKYAHQPHSINLGDAETLQHHLDTRFAQLGCSVELELWQEAFRSVEDVHNLLTMANANNKSTAATGAAGAKTGAAGFGGMVKPSMMAGYYDKLAKIFLMSGNALYHAAALGRYYALATSSSTAALSAEETRELAGRVLISALAVPSTSSSSATGSGTSSSTTNRLTSLLNLSKPPTRASLLKDALSRDVLRLAPEEVKALYVKLEVEFEPLGLVGGVAPILAVLSGTNETSPNGAATENGAAGETKHLGGAGGSPYKGYLPLLHHALLARLLSHLSQVYDCIKIDYLRELVSPLDGVGLPTPAPHLEAYIMLCARRGQLDVRVDHAQGCIWFLDEPFVGLDSEDDSTPASGSTSTAGLTEEGTDVPSGTEGDRIQPSATSLVRTRLSSVAGCLHRALSLIQSPSAASSTQTESEVQAESRFLALITPTSSSSKGDSTSPLQQYRKSLLLHTSITARRRQLAQELAARAQAQSMTLQAEIARKAAAESARLSLLEASQREARRRQDEVERVRRAEAEKYAKGLVEGGVLGKEVVEKLSSTAGGALDTTTLIAAQVLALEKSKASFSTRLKGIAKRIDHLERAYRISELELLKGDWERQSVLDRTEHASRLLQTKEQARKYWEAEREEAKRLGRMYTNVGGGGAGDDTPPSSGTKGHWELRRDALLRRKGEEFALKREKAIKRIELEKNKRREEVAKKIAQRKADLAAEAAAEARREAEEREAFERQEQEEREREEREREEREREEREREEREREEREMKEKEEREREEKRKEREEERRKTAEIAQLQAKREEEALERRRLAKLGGGSGSPAGSVPATPTRASVFGSSGPTRSESPTPASGAAAPGKYRPGALGGSSAWRTKAAAKEAGDAGTPAPSVPSTPSAAAPAPAAAGGGWRAKEEAKRAAGGVDEPIRRSESGSGSAFGMRRTDSGSGGLRPSVSASTPTSGGSSAFSSSMRRTDSGAGASRPMRTGSPIPPKKEELKDEDGFTVVAPKAAAAGGGVWKPRRGGAAGGGGR